MQLINAIGIESRHGLRTIELVCGDVTQHPCSVLVVSTFRGCYAPDPGTVVNALHQRGFSVEAAAGAPALDLREPLGVWITPPVSGQPFGRVLCVEITGGSSPSSPADAMQNLFAGLAVLEAKGMEVHSVAMPFLGIGKQGIDPRAIVKPMIEQARATLRRSEKVQKITIVVLETSKAEIISQELDRQLGAHRTLMPQKSLTDSIINELKNVAQDVRRQAVGAQANYAESLLEGISRPDLQSAQLGLLARQMAEVVANSFPRSKDSIDLYKQINELANHGVSPWVVNYLHTLRVVGNEVVHIRERSARTPEELEAQDLAVCLFCLLRVARFWLQTLEDRPR